MNAKTPRLHNDFYLKLPRRMDNTSYIYLTGTFSVVEWDMGQGKFW